MPGTARFWDRHAQRYARQPIADEAAYHKKLQVTREYLRADMHVLEFGCGTGSTAISHAPYVQHIEAIDISPGMLEIARRKAALGKVDNVTFTCAAIDDFSVPAASLDAVLGLNILHLLPDIEAVLAKVHGMLKPGGVFVSSTICLGDSMLRVFKVIGPLAARLGLVPPIEVFKSTELVKSITAAGFDIAYQWRPDNSNTAFIVASKPA